MLDPDLRFVAGLLKELKRPLLRVDEERLAELVWQRPWLSVVGVGGVGGMRMMRARVCFFFFYLLTTAYCLAICRMQGYLAGSVSLLGLSWFCVLYFVFCDSHLIFWFGSTRVGARARFFLFHLAFFPDPH